MTELEHAIKHIKTRADAWAVKEVTEALRSIAERLDKALSQVSEIEENIIKYMKKYPNHVGNTDFWEGFYACRNVVLQLDDEEYVPKEQEPCDDAISQIKERIAYYENRKPKDGYDGVMQISL